MSTDTQAPPQKWMRHLRNNQGRQAALTRLTLAGLSAPGPDAPRLRDSFTPNWNTVATVWAEPAPVQSARIRCSVTDPDAVTAFLDVLGDAVALGRSKTAPAEGGALIGLGFAPSGLRTFRYYQEQRRLIDMQNWECYACSEQLHRALIQLLAGAQG
jgi:hypothetical protein